jgi:CRISPR-associated protein Cmr4
MFEATRMLFIYVETPLHAGTGRGLGAVDLPIQRERITGYPVVQASTVKGRLRAEAEAHANAGKDLTIAEVTAIFGPQTGAASDHAGALSAGDARVLLFPVRSLAGVFAWVTSADVLARFRREASFSGLNLGLPEAFSAPADDEAWVTDETSLVAGQSVVLEEFSFDPKKEQSAAIKKWADWLTSNALPSSSEYKYWREALPLKLCVLQEDAFRDFVLYSTEVQTHVRLNPETKTVKSGALWTSESLPTDTLLYAPLMATQSRASNVNLNGTQVIEKLVGLKLVRTQLAGDETTGQGIVALRFAGGTP